MKYLYYTIYLFYKRIIKIEKWGIAPIVYCSSIISILQTFILFSLVDFYLLYVQKSNYIDYPVILIPIVGVVFYQINWRFFEKREDLYLKEISSKPKIFRNLTVSLSLIFIFFILKLYFYTGDLVRLNNGF